MADGAPPRAPRCSPAVREGLPPLLGGTLALVAAGGLTYRFTGSWPYAAAAGIPTALLTAYLVRTSTSRRTAALWRRWRESADVVAKLAERLKNETNVDNLRRPLPINLALLGAVQRKRTAELEAAGSTDNGAQASTSSIANSLLSAVFAPASPTSKELHEAEHFMRFATAAYGHALMAALGAQAALIPSVVAASAQRGVSLDVAAIAKHTGIGEKDLRLVRLDLGEDPHCPRHFVAVDRVTRSVVLAIRGTASISDALVHDLVADATAFAGGHAHRGMADAAHTLRTTAVPAALEALAEHPGYDFVVTGHSLGAGAACLLTTLLLHDARAKKGMFFSRGTKTSPSDEVNLPEGTRLRCFAFAPPPVFAGDAAGAPVTEAVVVGEDVVPHLSVYAVREVLEALARIDTVDLPLRSVLSVATGARSAPRELCDAVARSGTPAKRTRSSIAVAPKLSIPAKRIVHLPRADSQTAAARMVRRRRRRGSRHDERTAPNGVTACTPDAFADALVVLAPEMVSDHLFTSYERALRQAAGERESV